MVRITGRSTTDEANDPAFLARLAFDADVVEAAAVPKRDEIAMQAVFVVPVALLAVDERLQRILANAACAAEFDGFDYILGRLAGPGDADGSEGGGRGRRSCELGGCCAGAVGTVSKGFGGVGGCCCCCCCGWLLWRGLEQTSTGAPTDQKGRGDKSSSQAATPVKHHLRRVPFHSATMIRDVLSPSSVSRQPPGRVLSRLSF